MVTPDSATRPGARLLFSGFRGKLPSHGDYVGRGLPADWVRGWDDWLDAGLEWAARERGAAWLREALARPRVWCGVIRPADPVAATWCVLLAPSKDRVGRRFPLTLAELWSGDGPGDLPAVQARMDRLRALLVQAQGGDAADRLARAMAAHGTVATRPAVAGLQPPDGARDVPQPGEAGRSWWWPAADGASAGLYTQPWPTGAQWLAFLLDPDR